MIVIESARLDTDNDVHWQAWPAPATDSEKRRVDRIRLAVSLGLLLIWSLTTGT